VPSHLLDRKLFDFSAVAADGVEAEEGDKAFDAEDFSSGSTIPVRMI
jgi:tRNA 2-thiocytidine biosynthesis protein TtcA